MPFKNVFSGDREKSSEVILPPPPPLCPSCFLFNYFILHILLQMYKNDSRCRLLLLISRIRNRKKAKATTREKGRGAIWESTGSYTYLAFSLQLSIFAQTVDMASPCMLPSQCKTCFFAPFLKLIWANSKLAWLPVRACMHRRGLSARSY
jgi:hypothetical protein